MFYIKQNLTFLNIKKNKEYNEVVTPHLI